jgi:hypothetical protein
VNDYDLHPASGFWSSGPLPIPTTMEGALEAAASPDKVVLVRF